MHKIFIDGREGTTGLKIFERFSERNDIELITLDESVRKDRDARARAINSSDITFLCLPDDAAVESAELCTNPNTVIIDTSTAHRCDDGWAYGFPELSKEHFDRIKSGKRIAVPGCHASGFISLVYPLTARGILRADADICATSLTGYSGGGKKMIAMYEAEDRPKRLNSPRPYALSQNHKHLPEMKKVCGLEKNPHFIPIVDDYFSGMLVTVPLFADALTSPKSRADIEEIFREHYKDSPLISVVPPENAGGMPCAEGLSGLDGMEITVAGCDERILLVSRFDNLGKGASGAAVECMNISLGLSDVFGLKTER